MSNAKTTFEEMVRSVSNRLQAMDHPTFMKLLQEHENGDIAQLISNSGYFEATELETERANQGNVGFLSFEIPVSEFSGYASTTFNSLASSYVYFVNQISSGLPVMYECDNYGSYMFTNLYQTDDFAEITTYASSAKNVEDEDYLWAA